MPTAAETVAKKAFEYVGEIAEASTLSASVTWAAIFKRCLAEPVICCALLRVFQDVVSFRNCLELGFGFIAAGITVGMAFHRNPAIRSLQRLFIRRPLYF